MPKPRSSRPAVIGHRGASADLPENTRAAFEAALAAGVDGIELDLQLSRDGVPVVFHDDTLDAVGRAGRRVRDLTWDELRAIDVGDERMQPVTMMTLDDVLQEFAARTSLLLEIKAPALERRSGDARRLAAVLVDRLAAVAALDRAYLLSFDADCLAHARDLHAGVRTVLNTSDPMRLAASEIAVHDALSVDVDRLTAAVAALASAASIPLMTYTVNDETALARAVATGAAFVMTDRPAWMIARLRPDVRS